MISHLRSKTNMGKAMVKAEEVRGCMATKTHDDHSFNRGAANGWRAL